MAVKKPLWHALKTEEALRIADSTSDGLTEQEAQIRLVKFGLNELPKPKPYSKLRLFLNQFANPLMYILLATVAISIFLKHYSDTIFIVLVLLSNVVVAYYQENKAGNAISKLKKIVKNRARVIRDEHEKEIDGKDLVRGDIVVLNSGDKVPADARILECRNFKANEASLTGESMPVSKKNVAVKEKTLIAEQVNMVFMGTIIAEGSAKVLIVETGTQTQIGKIVKMLEETTEELTPLQTQMNKLAKFAALFIVGVIILILVIGLIRFNSPGEILLASLSLAVSAIPAGLLPAITIILVLAMHRILKQKGLVRKIISTETLGSITVICTDKTGTLTEGKMEVTHFITVDSELAGNKIQKFKINNSDPKFEAIKFLSKITLLDNDAFLENPNDKPEKWSLKGKITEQALLKAGTLMGFDKKSLEQEHLLIDKLYFSSELKFSASLREIGDKGYGLFVVGSPEYVFGKSSAVFLNDNFQNSLNKFEKKTEDLTNKGLRLLAIAYKEFTQRPAYKNMNEIVNGLTLVGVVALEDPIREGVADSIAITKKAGIRTVLVTGDHKNTAMAVADEVGLDQTDKILEGPQIENMSDKQLQTAVNWTSIFARVTPAHKLRIVDAYQANGEIVAMVGDGVNDAPALKSADIGVSLNSGTDVAKDVADLILLDDGFHSITRAIEQGRVIFSNIRKVFVYLLADDFQELFVFLSSMLLGLPLPLLPAQILWINLVEDGLPDLSLTTEQETGYVMDQKPRLKSEPVLSAPIKRWLTCIFFITGICALTLFFAGITFTQDLEKTRSMLFVLMGLDSLIFAFSARSFRKTILRKDIFSNRYLVGAVAVSLALLLSAIYTPFLQKLLSVQALGLIEWLVVLSVSIMEITLIEFSKLHLLIKHAL